MQPELNLDYELESCYDCGEDFQVNTRTQWQKAIDRDCDLDVCHPCGEANFRSCYECNNTVHRRDTNNGYCYDCYDEIFGECSECYGTYERNDLDYDDGRCYECENSHSEVINRDGWDAPETPWGDAKGGPHYGFEWEVEIDGNLDSGANAVMDKLPTEYCILKDDSTIDHGFELCTRPATIEEHKKAWKGYWKNPVRAVQSGSHVGVHVHISRAPLSQLQIGKMIVFCHGEENEKFIERAIAERHNRTYADFKKRRKITDVCKAYHDRDAVNLDNNKTIELRFFKSTTNEVKFWKNLEFAQALVSFTHNSAHSIREMNWKVFQKFVKRHKATWPNLHKVIADYNE